MKTNHKQAFANKYTEYDVLSKYWRKMVCNLINNPSVIRRCKRAINKRFRKYNRNILNFVDDSELIKH